MHEFVVGLCMALLLGLVLFWEWEADRRWSKKWDVEIPDSWHWR